MSTLGYGDIVFRSDPGRFFSLIVLSSGIVFLLGVLPSSFMEFVYAPWVSAHEARQVPRTVASDLKGHIILTVFDPVVSALIIKLKQFKYQYVVVLPEIERVIRLREDDIEVVHGELGDPETYQRVRAEHAALVATTRSDIANTTVTFTVRGVAPDTPVVATAREDGAKDVLRLAGCSRVVSLHKLMAEALARRAIGGNSHTHVIGTIDDLVIAEVDVVSTPLGGRLVRDAQEASCVSIVGFWVRGIFEIAQPESPIDEKTVLVVAGSKSQVNDFEKLCQNHCPPVEVAPVIVIGGGRVGRETVASLARRGIASRVIERDPERLGDQGYYVHGSAAERHVLQSAGIDKSPTVIITTRDDETNIYLTILCRLLRPDIQIICRSTLEQSVAALHRAGSDIVMSYATMGASALINLLQRTDLLMIAEGLDVFKVPVPAELAGKTLAEAHFRKETGCSVIGIDAANGTLVSPGPDSVLTADAEMVLIGSPAGEAAFLKQFTQDKFG